MDDLEVTDGRTLRRHRNIERVLAALVDLAAEGHPVAGSEQLSQRSGVSLRSIYRFFPTQEDLVLAAMERQVQRSDHLFRLPGAGEGPLEQRTTAYVARRLKLYGETTALAAITQATAGSMPRLRAAIHERRTLLLGMVRDQFRPELDSMSESRRRHTELAIHVMCQRESFDALLVEQALSTEDAADLLAAGILALLAPGAERGAGATSTAAPLPGQRHD